MIPRRADDREAILITGSGGFVGRAVVRVLQQSGQNLVLLDQIAHSESGGEDSCTGVACDISDATTLRRVFEEKRIGGIIHLAAILPTAASRDPARATQVNVVGSLNVLEIAHEFSVRRVVFGSSLSIYGNCPQDEAVSETHKAAPEDLYGAAKLYIEQLGKVYADLHGIEFVSLRIGRVVGPGARSTTSAWRSEIFESLTTTRSAKIEIPCVETERILVVHVDDVAKALVALLQVPRPGHSVYNAPCESVLVADLKRHIESLNRNVTVMLGNESAIGNPRRLDWSRFAREFWSDTLSVFERLRRTSLHRSTT